MSDRSERNFRELACCPDQTGKCELPLCLEQEEEGLLCIAGNMAARSSRQFLIGHDFGDFDGAEIRAAYSTKEIRPIGYVDVQRRIKLADDRLPALLAIAQQ